MKKISIILIVFIMALSVLTFAGCKVQPYEVDWHFECYQIGDEYYFVGLDDYNHFGSIMHDSVEISFEKDNSSFNFKSYDGTQYNGTYKTNNRNKDTEVILTFPDGSQANGYCKMSVFDGVWYDARFEIFGVTYWFDSQERGVDLDYCLSNIAESARYFAQSGKNKWKNALGWYSDYQNAVIEKFHNHYYVVTENNEYPLADSNFWCYTFESSELKSSELTEGECIVRIGVDRFAIYYPEK